jgi:hypothetical protein
MSSQEEVNQLRERIQDTVDNIGINNYLYNLAKSANAKFNEQTDDTEITLNKEEYTLLKLMMTDYLKNNFNKRIKF